MAKSGLIDQMRVTDRKERLWCGWRSTPTIDVNGSIVAHLNTENIERHRFTLEISAQSDFWCRFGDYERALNDAQRGMVRGLHQDVFGLVDQMRRAIYKADEKELLRLCDELEREMGWR